MAVSKVIYKSSASATPVTWIDATTATAVAADILAPKTAMLADGVMTTGTGTGGGNDFIVSLSKNNQTGYWEPDKTWSEVSAAIADNKTFFICIAGMTHNSELAADGSVYNDGITAYLSYVVYETLQDQSNNYYVNEYWYSFRSTGLTQESPYVYYDTSNADATAADILSGKTAFTSSGSVSGSIPSKTSSDLTANNLTVTAPSGYYASAASKTLSDQNLVAGNIKKDVTIFGTTGTYEGSGSGLSYESGSITIATNTQYLIVTGLGGTPKFIKFIIHDAATNVGDGTLKSVSGIYVMGASMVRATNNAGSGYGYTAFGTEAAWEASTQTVYENGTQPAAAGQIYATTSGFSVRSYSSSYSFKAGYTFDWQVWY